jgi:8-oxo-dGTP pyrophosphatase MutT (NUDIX family)
MGKGAVQYAALPWRSDDGAVLLITTRTTRRWIIPKGWPIDGLSPHEAAAQEAWEEAGVRGEVGVEAVGAFHYDKVRKDGSLKGLRVDVFPLKVTEELADWPEARERERRWMTPAEAAEAVTEPELAALIRGWSPAA